MYKIQACPNHLLKTLLLRDECVRVRSPLDPGLQPAGGTILNHPGVDRISMNIIEYQASNDFPSEDGFI